MVHIVFEDEDNTSGQTGKQNFKVPGKSVRKKDNKQPKNSSIPNKYSVPGKYRETRKKKNKSSIKMKKPPGVGEKLFPYEENELMTRYEGFWILKEGTEQLTQLKSTLEKKQLGNKEMKKKLHAAKRLAHSKLKRELMKRQKQKNWELKSLENAESVDSAKNVQSLELKSHKKLKKTVTDGDVHSNLSKNKTGSDKKKVEGKTKLSAKISHSSKDKDHWTLQNKEKTSQKLVPSANSETGSTEGISIDCSPPNKKNKDKVKQTTKGSKRKFMETDDNLLQNQEVASQKKLKSKSRKTDFAEKDTVTCSAQIKNIVPLKFEENDLMTQFEGSWVMRTVIPQLNHLREEHLKHIYSIRENGNSDGKLTKEEQQHFHLLMKKKIRMEYRKLRRVLTNQGRRECKGKVENLKEDSV